jgi:hypothetical protein
VGSGLFVALGVSLFFPSFFLPFRPPSSFSPPASFSFGASLGPALFIYSKGWRTFRGNDQEAEYD